MLVAESAAKVPWPRELGAPFWNEFVLPHQHFTEPQEGSGWKETRPAWLENFHLLETSLFDSCCSAKLPLLRFFFSLFYQVRSIYEHLYYIEFRKNISRPVLKSKECLKVEKATKSENITFTFCRIQNWRKTAQFHHSVKAKFGTQLFTRSWDVTATVPPHFASVNGVKGYDSFPSWQNHNPENSELGQGPKPCSPTYATARKHFLNCLYSCNY